MNTIPLVKGNTQEEINTSLIALKKALDEMNSSSGKTDASVQLQIKQINELIENINTHLDTVDEQITDLQPVDTVTSGNMKAVTSNAVYNALVNEDTQIFTTQYKNDSFTFTKIGKVVYIQSTGDWINLPAQQSVTLFGLPSKYYPKNNVALREQTNQNIAIFISTNGTVSVYNYGSGSGQFNGNYIGCWVSAN
jgi:NAD-specific glutamate dehydrogenase